MRPNGNYVWKNLEIAVDLSLAVAVLVIGLWLSYILSWWIILIVFPTAVLLFGSAVGRAYMLGRVGHRKDIGRKEEER